MLNDPENIILPGVIPDADPVRELIVVARAEAGLRAMGTDVSSATGTDVGALSLILTDAGARMEPLFGDSEGQVRMRGTVPAGAAGDIDLALFYRVQADDRRLDDLARVLGVQ